MSCFFKIIPIVIGVTFIFSFKRKSDVVLYCVPVLVILIVPTPPPPYKKSSSEPASPAEFPELYLPKAKAECP